MKNTEKITLSMAFYLVGLFAIVIMALSYAATSLVILLLPINPLLSTFLLTILALTGCASITLHSALENTEASQRILKISLEGFLRIAVMSTKNEAEFKKIGEELAKKFKKIQLNDETVFTALEEFIDDVVEKNKESVIKTPPT